MGHSPSALGGPRARLAAVASFALACATDTSGLARRAPMESEGGGGGATPVIDGPPSQAGAGGVAGSEALDPGAGSLTLVNGIVDGGSLFLCLREAESGQPLREGAPEPAAGMTFGGAHRIELDWDLSAVAVEADLIAVVPERARGRSCADLLSESDASSAASESDAGALDGGREAGAPPVPFPSEATTPRRAGTLALAAGALRPGVDYVLVASGCATVGIDGAGDICGPADPFSTSFVALPLVALGAAGSQPEPFFGLQFLNGSRAVAAADVVLQGASQGADSVRLANSVQFGALRPRNVVSVEEPVGIELHVEAADPADYVQSWSETASFSGIEAVEPGRAYALVYVGPNPRALDRAGLAPPRFVIVARP